VKNLKALASDFTVPLEQVVSTPAVVILTIRNTKHRNLSLSKKSEGFNLIFYCTNGAGGFNPCSGN
jgi:hypothetical protein